MSLFSALLAVGLLFVAASLALALNEHRFISRGTITEGTVVENVRKNKGYTPKISFRTTQGKEVAFSPVFNTNPPSYKVGEAVRIVYRGEGEGARILSFGLRFGLAWPLLCFGLAVVLVALGFRYGDALLLSRYAGSAIKPLG